MSILDSVAAVSQVKTLGIAVIVGAAACGLSYYVGAVRGHAAAKEQLAAEYHAALEAAVIHRDEAAEENDKTIEDYKSEIKKQKVAYGALYTKYNGLRFHPTKCVPTVTTSKPGADDAEPGTNGSGDGSIDLEPVAKDVITLGGVYDGCRTKVEALQTTILTQQDYINKTCGKK